MKCNINKKTTKYHEISTICCNKLPKNLFKYVLLVLIFSTKYSNSIGTNNTTSNDFVERCRRDCVIKRDVVVCGKYRVVRWLHEVVREKVNTIVFIDIHCNR